MRLIDGSVDWTDHARWAWPDGDAKLLQVFDQVNDIQQIMMHVDRAGLCIQAGGACGVWPKRFAQYFGTVVTLEPHPENFGCLVFNAHEDNIISIQAALGDRRGWVDLKLHETEQNNAGAYYTTSGDAIEVMTIDSLDCPDCDLIQLDIEGSERRALEGAAGTIEEHRPVIVIEEKELPQCPGRTGDARAWLEANGYREVDRMHRDVVFRPC